MRIEKAKIHLVIRLLCESSGIRAISRLTGLHQETVLKILKISGELSSNFTEQKVKDLKCEVVQADELHTTVYSKEFNTNSKDTHIGSQYTFLAIDAKSRLVINAHTGQRTTENAVKFLTDLRRRTSGRFQLNTDCWRGYYGQRNSVKAVFGNEIDHATEQKHFWKTSAFVSRSLAKTERKARIGNPDISKGSTSYVERLNLSVRHFNRRFTRCTPAFSKKLVNLRYSVSLFVWSINFARKHGTIKTTPAIAAGISTAIVTVQELWNCGD